MREKEKQHWFLRLIGAPFLGEIEEVADVRWFSECNVDERTCKGHLLGRWHMTEAQIQPAEYDFRPYPEDLELLDGAIVDYTHNVIVDFAFTPDEGSCVLRLTDLRGRVLATQYEVSNGASSPRLGQSIGSTVSLSVDRNKPGACIPPGWCPRPSDSA